MTEGAPATLRDGFLASAAAFGDRPALEVEGRVLTYAELHSRAAALAATLRRELPDADPPLSAVLGARSATVFAGVLGALLRGHGYVPLNPKFPADRTAVMLTRAGCQALIVDEARLGLLEEVLSSVPGALVIVVPDVDDLSGLAERWPQHRFVGRAELEPAASWSPEPVSADAIAYLLFTSGSTGTPKGVMVAHRNLRAFIDIMVERYGIGSEDRFSQTFDLTFDLSVFDMFVAWERGACVCCPPEQALMAPGRFIRDRALTVWFSVPSTGVFMRKLKQLKPGSFPSLRWSLFCGEPLPAEVARAFADAAPGSVVENLYGPTELTLACTLYRWDPAISPTESALGMVPIGQPYPGMTALVVDDQLREVEPGSDGELLMAGPQVTLGYWRDREKTAAAFVVPPGRESIFYRTGDRVRRPLSDDPLTYRGRVDHQIKVLGHRVELGEIEAAIREEADVDAVVAVGWPPTPAGVGGVVAFIAELELDVDGLLESLARRLPAYMVPRDVRLLAELPLNANGKYDRKALRRSLNEAPEPSVR